jgi:hypothetical protein
MFYNILKTQVRRLSPDIKGTATECDDCQIDVLMNWAEYKKRKKFRSIGSKMPLTFAFDFLNVTSLNWSRNTFL